MMTTAFEEDLRAAKRGGPSLAERMATPPPQNERARRVDREFRRGEARRWANTQVRKMTKRPRGAGRSPRRAVRIVCATRVDAGDGGDGPPPGSGTAQTGGAS